MGKNQKKKIKRILFIVFISLIIIFLLIFLIKSFMVKIFYTFDTIVNSPSDISTTSIKNITTSQSNVIRETFVLNPYAKVAVVPSTRRFYIVENGNFIFTIKNIGDKEASFSYNIEPEYFEHYRFVSGEVTLELDQTKYIDASSNSLINKAANGLKVTMNEDIAKQLIIGGKSEDNIIIGSKEMMFPRTITFYIPSLVAGGNMYISYKVDVKKNGSPYETFYVLLERGRKTNSKTIWRGINVTKDFFN